MAPCLCSILRFRASGTRCRLFILAAALLVLSALPAFARTFTDPAPYCRAVGTIDKPDSRYTGPKLPGWMAAKLGMKPGDGRLMEWRCAKGAVLACRYGANIPCDAKAATSRKPTPAVARYCHENPDADFVPMYVTGHRTVVSWACRGRRPAVIRVGAVDARGYAKAFWHQVAP